MLNEKLDSLVRELNDESQAIVVPEGTAPAASASPEARDSSEEGHFHPGPMGPRMFKSKEQLMLRANSLKKALRQIIEQAEKGEDRLPGGAWTRSGGTPIVFSLAVTARNGTSMCRGGLPDGTRYKRETMGEGYCRSVILQLRAGPLLETGCCSR